MPKIKPNHILLVEDNEGDILLTTEALQEHALADKITVIRDGKLAIEFLNSLVKIFRCLKKICPDRITLV